MADTWSLVWRSVTLYINLKCFWWSHHNKPCHWFWDCGHVFTVAMVQGKVSCVYALGSFWGLTLSYYMLKVQTPYTLRDQRHINWVTIHWICRLTALYLYVDCAYVGYKRESPAQTWNWVCMSLGMSERLTHIPSTHISMNHSSLKTRPACTCHPLHRASIYQASSAVLGWLRDASTCMFWHVIYIHARWCKSILDYCSLVTNVCVHKL